MTALPGSSGNPSGSISDAVFSKASGVGIRVDQDAPTFPWQDMMGIIEPQTTGANAPTLTSYIGNVFQYKFAVNDWAVCGFHVPHDYVPGTDLYAHIHWSHNSAVCTGGTAVFNLEWTYSKGHNQAAFGATKNLDFTGTASTTQYQHIITENAMTSAGGSATLIDRGLIEVDGLILIRCQFKTNNITTSGAAITPFVHFVDIHYQTTGIGTKQKAPGFYT